MSQQAAAMWRQIDVKKDRNGWHEGLQLDRACGGDDRACAKPKADGQVTPRCASCYGQPFHRGSGTQKSVTWTTAAHTECLNLFL